MAAELTCARRTRIIVEEDGEQILLRKENKKKKNGVRTPLVPKEDKKGLNEPQTTIFHLSPIRSVVKEYCRDARIPRYRGQCPAHGLV